ncbi:signaling lymphocytic activation molecule-like [Triplophysa rosa]|uniref:signaling lymphocytic activation molecule-like n=1 Tax=Triplophysa rosa TaxID=992332 RepID=UPI00254621EB|nr:signaling lymphocytic activation molecule-like [Triplophysa rosa]
MEGDSVTLHIDVSSMEILNVIWLYGPQDFHIVTIPIYSDIALFHGNDERFRDRLQVTDKTGSLTINNITTELSGLYQTMGDFGADLATGIFIKFHVTVYTRLPVPVIIRDCSSSSSVSKCVVLCSVMNVSHVSVSWYKGKSFLSSISVSDLNIRLSLPLEVEYQDNNTYRCVINNPISNHTQHLHITEICHTCSEASLTLNYAVVICCVVGSVMIVTALLIICICRKHATTG